MRASEVGRRQLMSTAEALRLTCQAATSRSTFAREPMRQSRRWRLSALSTSSVIVSQVSNLGGRKDLRQSAWGREGSVLHHPYQCLGSGRVLLRQIASEARPVLFCVVLSPRGASSNTWRVPAFFLASLDDRLCRVVPVQSSLKALCVSFKKTSFLLHLSKGPEQISSVASGQGMQGYSCETVSPVRWLPVGRKAYTEEKDYVCCCQGRRA